MKAEVVLSGEDGTEFTATVEVDHGDATMTKFAPAEAARVLAAATSAVETAAGIVPDRYFVGSSRVHGMAP